MIYKIKSQKQLINLIKHCAMLRIFTNGKDVYAWNSEFTDHQHARKMLGGLDESYNSYTIENNGRLLHCVVINYQLFAQGKNGSAAFFGRSIGQNLWEKRVYNCL